LKDVFDKFMDIYSCNIEDKEVVQDDNTVIAQTLDAIIEHVVNDKSNDVTICNNLTELMQKQIRTDQNRLKQKRHREKNIIEQGIDVVRVKDAEKKRNQRNRNIVSNKNKKTDEEKREEARLKKQRQRAELKEKYSDEEYKQMRAMEIAAYRKKIKGN
jgi:uncharacterized protein with WD repeat